jgi:hypothetical protein
VIKLSLFLGAAPNHCRTLSVYAVGQVPGLFGKHGGDDSHQGVHHVLKSIEVVVKHNHLEIGVWLAQAESLLNRAGGRKDHNHGLQLRTL